MKTHIIEHRTYASINVLLASTELYIQPFRKHSSYPKKKRRRGGIKTGYLIYIFAGDNPDQMYKHFGYRILTKKKALAFYEHCCAHARNFKDKLVDNYLLPLWAVCNCNDAIYKKRSHIDIIKYFGNKDCFPTFYMFLLENNLIQPEIDS